MSEGMSKAIDIVSTEAQQLFAALSHPIMLEVLFALHRSPAAVTVLAEQLECEISAISRKLNTLYGLNLVRYTRIGRSHIYQLTSHVQIERTTDQCLISITTQSGTSIQIAYDIST